MVLYLHSRYIFHNSQTLCIYAMNAAQQSFNSLMQAYIAQPPQMDQSLDKKRIEVLLQINTVLLYKCIGLQQYVLSQQNSTATNYNEKKELYQNYLKRIHYNLTCLASINDIYSNSTSNKRNYTLPQIVFPPPECPELFEHYKLLNQLYPEAMPFFQKKMKLARQQQQQQQPHNSLIQNQGSLKNSFVGMNGIDKPTMNQNSPSTTNPDYGRNPNPNFGSNSNNGPNNPTIKGNANLNFNGNMSVQRGNPLVSQMQQLQQQQQQPQQVARFPSSTQSQNANLNTGPHSEMAQNYDSAQHQQFQFQQQQFQQQHLQQQQRNSNQGSPNVFVGANYSNNDLIKRKSSLNSQAASNTPQMTPQALMSSNQNNENITGTPQNYHLNNGMNMSTDFSGNMISPEQILARATSAQSHQSTHAQQQQYSQQQHAQQQQQGHAQQPFQMFDANMNQNENANQGGFMTGW